jgi:hypothetical protein
MSTVTSFMPSQKRDTLSGPTSSLEEQSPYPPPVAVTGVPGGPVTGSRVSVADCGVWPALV